MKNIFIALLLMDIVSIMAIPDELRTILYQFERVQKKATAKDMFSHLTELKRLCVNNTQALGKHQPLLDALCNYIGVATALEIKSKYTVMPSKGYKRQKMFTECARKIEQLNAAQEKVSAEFAKLT